MSARKQRASERERERGLEHDNEVNSERAREGASEMETGGEL